MTTFFVEVFARHTIKIKHAPKFAENCFSQKLSYTYISSKCMAMSPMYDYSYYYFVVFTQIQCKSPDEYDLHLTAGYICATVNSRM